MKPEEYVIGVDLGGTNVRAAAVSSTGAISARVKQASRAADGYKKVVKNIRSVIKQVILNKKRDPAACGLASAGAIDFDKMVITSSPNFPDWKNAPIVKEARIGYRFPFVLENDANAAALGEGWLGAAKMWSDFVTLTLGTGIGGGVVMGGAVWRGPLGMAGEIGHITVNPGGRRCGCGNLGCLETTASATGVALTAMERIGDRGADWLRKKTGDNGNRIDAELITRGATQKDPFCLNIIKEAGRDLGAAIASVSLVLGVSRYVICGGMAPAFKIMRPVTRKTALRMAYTLTGPKLKIVESSLGDDAGIIGAAKTAMEAVK